MLPETFSVYLYICGCDTSENAYQISTVSEPTRMNKTLNFAPAAVLFFENTLPTNHASAETSPSHLRLSFML